MRTRAALVRRWVTYAYANCGPGGDKKARAACHERHVEHCRVIQYLDTNWIYVNGSPPWPSFRRLASESWYQHLPGSTTVRIQSRAYGGGYLIDQKIPDVQAFFKRYVAKFYNRDDGLMMDDQSPSLASQLYYATCQCDETNEIHANHDLQMAHEALSASLVHSNDKWFFQIDNSLPANPNLPQGLDMLRPSTGVHGVNSEGSPMDDGHLVAFYSTLLDEIAAIDHGRNSFAVLQSYGRAGASYQATSRRVQEATILLGFKPGHLVDWADLELGSKNLAVWPEEAIYPTDPVESMSMPSGSGCLAGNGQVCATGGHRSVQTAPGVYRREFEKCYDNGRLFGPCAAIVNTTDRAAVIRSSWLRLRYHHEITFDGGDIQSGGRIDRSGAIFKPGEAVVGAEDAIILDT